MLGLSLMSVLSSRSEPQALDTPTTTIRYNTKPHLVMVERNGLRYKADKALREGDLGHDRIRMDIRHCYLPKLPVITENSSLREKSITPSVLLVAKHLCGLATDLAVSSVHSLFRNSEDGTSPGGPLFHGLAIATCCHHACSWEDYTGVDWLCGSKGFTEREFNVMKQWSGWAHTIKPTGVSATAADAPIAKAGDDEDNEAFCCEHSAPVSASTIRPHNLSLQDLPAVGKMVKRIFDQGRVEYLRQLGLTAHQLQYCEPSLSPECFMILATPGHSDCSRSINK